MEYEKEQRIEAAFKFGPRLFGERRIADFFDTVYKPSIWDNRLQPLMLRLCYEESAICELRDDQVAQLLHDATTSMQPLPQYLYAYWLYSNRIRWTETPTIAKMMRWAADCGIGDAAWFLRNLWLSGEAGVKDEELALKYTKEAEAKHSPKAFANKVECELFGTEEVEPDPMHIISVLRDLLDLSNDPKDEAFPEADDEGPDRHDPLLWHLLAEAYIATGQFWAAEKCARKAVEGGLINRGYADLFHIYTHNEKGEEAVDWERLLPLYHEGSNKEDPNTLLNAACYLMDHCDDERTTDEQREQYYADIHNRMERAAQLGNKQACLLLASTISESKYGYERDWQAVWKWYHRGAMSGEPSCFYNLYYMMAWAEDTDEEAYNEQLKFLVDGTVTDYMPANDWKRLAQKVYEAQGLDWPCDYGEEHTEEDCGEADGETGNTDEEPADEAKGETFFDIKGTVLRRCTVGDSHVVIPDGITEIADSCFVKPGTFLTGQDKLVSVVIPPSVTRIGKHAFLNCERLEDVTILGPADIGEGAFASCSSLHDVWLADGIRSIGDNCFAFNEQLKSLFIPASVEKMGACMAAQNEDDCEEPYLFCERTEEAPGWDKNWNAIGIQDDGTAVRHKTFYGLMRNGFLKESVDALIPPKPDVLPAPINPDDEDEVSERCEAARELIAQQRWTDAFDLLYTPQMPSFDEHKRLLNIFGSMIFAACRLRPDQIERLRQDAARKQPTACYIYGYWATFNTSRLSEFDAFMEQLELAGEAGYADAWHALYWLWDNGLNAQGVRDSQKAQDYLKRCLADNGSKGVTYRQIKPLLYGWDDTPVNAQEALRLTQRLIREEGGEEQCDPRLLSLLSDCSYSLSRPEYAERYARKAIRRGDTVNGYLSLHIALFVDSEGNECDDRQEEKARLQAEAVACHVPFFLSNRSDDLIAEAENEPDADRRQQLCHEARVLLEQAAWQGNGDACFSLARKANAGEMDFYGPRSSDMYPFLHRGALTGHKDCVYWLTQMASIAQDEDTPLGEREIVFGSHHDNTPAAVWEKIAHILYERDDEPYPALDDSGTDGDRNDNEAGDATQAKTEDENINVFDIRNWHSRTMSLIVGQIETWPIMRLNTDTWQDWFDDARHRIEENPLQMTVVSDVTVKVYLGKGYEDPTIHYMDFPDEAFPHAFYRQAYADDKDDMFTDVTGMRIVVEAIDSDDQPYTLGRFFFGNEDMHRLHQAAKGNSSE